MLAKGSLKASSTSPTWLQSPALENDLGSAGTAWNCVELQSDLLSPPTFLLIKQAQGRALGSKNLAVTI